MDTLSSDASVTGTQSKHCNIMPNRILQENLNQYSLLLFRPVVCTVSRFSSFDFCHRIYTMYNPLLNPQSTSIVKWMVRKSHPLSLFDPVYTQRIKFQLISCRHLSNHTMCLILLLNHTPVQIGLTATLNQPLVERCKTDLGTPF